MLNKLKLDLLKARKEKDTLRMSVLGFLLAKIQNKEIELRVTKEELTDEHIEKVLRKQIKDRTQSIDLYRQGGRNDLAEKEESEKRILEEVLNVYFA